MPSLDWETTVLVTVANAVLVGTAEVLLEDDRVVGLLSVLICCKPLGVVSARPPVVEIKLNSEPVERGPEVDKSTGRITSVDWVVRVRLVVPLVMFSKDAFVAELIVEGVLEIPMVEV
jgi:hypothetical protein